MHIPPRDNDRTSPAETASREASGPIHRARLSASIAPADAGAARERLLAEIAAARAEGAGIEIEIEEGRPLPCALQLLAAARASADAGGWALRFGPRAAEALGLPAHAPSA